MKLLKKQYYVILIISFTIFVSSSYSSDNSPIKDFQIAISLNDIFINNITICSTSSFELTDTSANEYISFCFLEELQSQANQKYVNEKTVLQCDKYLKFYIVYGALNTLVHAGFYNIKFGILGDIPDNGYISNSEKVKIEQRDSLSRISLLIEVDKEKFKVVHYSGKIISKTFKSREIFIKKAQKYLNEIANNNSKASDIDDVLISVSDETIYDNLILAMDYAQVTGFTNTLIKASD